MKALLILSIAAIVLASGCIGNAQSNSFSYKNVTVKWLGHAGFELSGSKKIYADPFKIRLTDEADFVLITHDHFDHCDKDSISRLKANDTIVIGTIGCVKTLRGHINSFNPGDSMTFTDGIKIEAVEAYNTNASYHPKGTGMGFLITIDNVTIYHAGDTDFIPEMSSLPAIDITLLPIGGKYTMNVDEAAEAAKAINPVIVVPMHYNSGALGINDVDADPNKLAELLKGTGIEVKILNY